MATDDAAEHDSTAAEAPFTFGDGRFVVRSPLGRGTFADVYLADDRQRGVPVAVKVLSAEWSTRPDARDRFVRGARLLRSINDPRVVAIHDIGETDDGRPFVAMDHAPGGTLEQRLRQLSTDGARPTRGDVLAIAHALADAVGFLHSRQITHGDLKPSNLLVVGDAGADGATGAVLRPGERLVIGDLGIAAAIGTRADVTGGAGNRRYAAPEHREGSAPVDPRADIYSASAVLAEMAEAGALGGNLDEALAQGMLDDPDRRPPTIQRWFADVGDALSPGRPAPPPPSARPTNPGPGPVPSATTSARTTARSRGRWRWAIAGIVGVLAIVALVVVVAVAS